MKGISLGGGGGGTVTRIKSNVGHPCTEVLPLLEKAEGNHDRKN